MRIFSNFSPVSLPVLLSIIFIAILPDAAAQSVLFDFDSAPAYTSLPIDLTVDGLTAHFNATGPGYSIQNANVLGFTPAAFAGHSIYPNSINLADLLIRFDQAVTDFSIMYSCQELGCDDAALMRVTVYSNGTYVGTNTRTAANPGTWPTDTLKCNFPTGFDSVVVHYDHRPPTCQDYGVIYMADNMRVTPLAPLAIQLYSFTASVQQNGQPVLHWSTATETNNYGFYVERRPKNSQTFATVSDIIPGAGTSLDEHSYEWTDVAATGGSYVYRLRQVDLDGRVSYSIEIVLNGILGVSDNVVSKKFVLAQNYPNPFNPETRIDYSLPGRSHVLLRVFDVLGKEVATLVNALQDAGHKSVRWNAENMPGGLYFYRIQAGEFTDVKRIVLMK